MVPLADISHLVTAPVFYGVATFIVVKGIYFVHKV